MKKYMAAALAMLLVPSFASAGTVVQDYTKDKAIADSLAATADVLGIVKIPADLTALYVCVIADSSVLYTVDVSLDGTEFATAFIDTCIKGTYDQHELGVPTSGTTLRVPAFGLLPGKYLRVTADNLTATTCYAKVLLKYEK